MNDAECIAFLQWALPRLHLRWAGFRKPRRQVCKRIRRRMGQLGLESAAAYRAYLEANSDEWGRLDGLCRVTISRFYRDRAVMDHLGAVVLPGLAELAERRGDRHLECWTIGCASGEEPYSLALIWHFRVGTGHPGVRLRIRATDVDPLLLERAREACYEPSSLRDLPPGWMAEAFERRAGLFCLRRRFRQGVVVELADVRCGGPPGPLDVILCRNVAFTYFDDGEQRRVLGDLLARLRPGGVLVLGSHERLPADQWPLAQDGAHPVYRRLLA